MNIIEFIFGKSKEQIALDNAIELQKCEEQRIAEGRPSITDMLSGGHQDQSKRTGSCKWCSYEMCYHPYNDALSNYCQANIMRFSCNGNERPTCCPLTMYEEWAKSPVYPPDNKTYCECCYSVIPPEYQMATMEPIYKCRTFKDIELKYTYLLYWIDEDHPVIFHHIVKPQECKMEIYCNERCL
jgi:hypothetical protein